MKFPTMIKIFFLQTKQRLFFFFKEKHKDLD